jgi:hypothetical protein
MIERGIVVAGRRKAPTRPRRKAAPSVPSLPPTHRYQSFDVWVRLGNELAAYYARTVEIIEAFEAEDREPPPDVNPKAWLWSEAPEVRLKRRRALDEAAQTLLFRFSAAELDAAVAEFRAGWDWFERSDVYEGPRDHRTVSVEFIPGGLRR